MKLRLVITGLIAMLVTVSTQATTLKLAPDIDLLVLDGRKISGSLLKGAEGLELEQGQHQFLFRVEKNLKKGSQIEIPWTSAPLIVTFTAQSQSITIKLPALSTLQQGKSFDKHPDFQLVDEHGTVVESRRDRLLNAPDDNFEQGMAMYNLKDNVASVPRFAHAHASTLPDGTGSVDFASDHHPTGRVLQLWYQQVDSATRQRFVLLLRALRTS